MSDQNSQDKPTPAEPEPKAPARVKPLVHYRELVFCHLGRSALVVPVDHPSGLVSNRGHTMTSAVTVDLDESGCFETLNTRYEPAPKLRM
jgi:hypothetical protein